MDIFTTTTPTSRERVITLQDGSKCNPHGTCVFKGVSSKLKHKRYTIHEIRRGTETKQEFIGVYVDSEIYRFSAQLFTKGTLGNLM